MASKNKSVKRSATTAGEKTGKAVAESHVEQAPEGKVLTTDQAIAKIERKSDPDGPSPRSF